MQKRVVSQGLSSELVAGVSSTLPMRGGCGPMNARHLENTQDSTIMALIIRLMLFFMRKSNRLVEQCNYLAEDVIHQPDNANNWITAFIDRRIKHVPRNNDT